MRICAAPDHPDYWGRRLSTAPLVYLDGRPCSFVYIADEERGLVEVMIVRDGDFARDEFGMPLTRFLMGKVEIHARPKEQKVS